MEVADTVRACRTPCSPARASPSSAHAARAAASAWRSCATWRPVAGAVQIESRDGAGTTVRVLLHAATPRPAPPPGAPAEAAAAAPCGEVLVATTRWPYRELMTLMLQRAGFAAVTVADGREAVEHVRAEPDRVRALVLLDHTMPEMNGDEAFREIRALRPEMPVGAGQRVRRGSGDRRAVCRGARGLHPQAGERDGTGGGDRKALAGRPKGSGSSGYFEDPQEADRIRRAASLSACTSSSASLRRSISCSRGRSYTPTSSAPAPSSRRCPG